MFRLVALISSVALALNLTASDIITNCLQLAQHIISSTGQDMRFQLNGVTVISTNDAALIAMDTHDASPHLHNLHMPSWAIRLGDTIDVGGFIAVHSDGECCAHFNHLVILKHGDPIAPRKVTGKEFLNKTNNFHHVEIQGVVKDVYPDDIDRKYIYLTILCQGEIICMPINRNEIATNHASIVGATICASGTCLPRLFGNRRYLGHTLQNPQVSMLSLAPADPFDAPDIARLKFASPSEIEYSQRHSTVGEVLCTWNQGRTILLLTENREIVQANLLHSNAPKIGTCVKAVGTPISNGHYVNLSRATWKECQTSKQFDNSKPTQATAREILSDECGQSQINPRYHGQLICLKGTIKSISDNAAGKRLFIEDESFLVQVDFSSCPDAFSGIEKDYVVGITGFCVMDIENWSPGNVFPLIKGFTLVPRSKEDISIISRPPWLTRTKLLVLSAGLALLLVAAFLWNLSLRILANRRGRELFRSQIAKISSELRVKERTRLAVELHDSLAQNLTGVSMEIEAADRSRKDGMDAVSQHLFVADKALKSCRAELRNSLWDLRNQALEEPDLDKAIRQTLLPHVKGVELSVRFNVPRSRFSDNTLHEILRIIRELTINGIRHGGATEIRIAGTIDGDRILFSVTDNGCGFDPDDRPGVTDGHFGLQGISERLDAHSGELSFFPAPGGGMKAVVTIPLPGQKDPEK